MAAASQISGSVDLFLFSIILNSICLSLILFNTV